MDRSTDEADRMLREREARSLRLLLRVLFGGFLVVAGYLVFHIATNASGAIGVEIVLGYLVFSIAVLAGLSLVLRLPAWVGRVGIAVAFLAATFTPIVALVMWRGFAAEAPASLLTKLPLAAAGIASMAAVALTLRPLYVAISGIGVALALLGFYGLATLDPTTTFVTTGAESYFGPAVSTTRLIMELIFVCTATTCMTLAVHFARQTMGEAIALQHSTDQISRYFSPDIARGILGGGDAFLRPGGKEQDVVVLFSDLAGYTRAFHDLRESKGIPDRGGM
ncbi:MAG: hypothetical protein HQ465_25255 [Rhodospirillales bacterium]|nr:hypothetical protein [Rhodospirillales bacterium]